MSRSQALDRLRLSQSAFEAPSLRRLVNLAAAAFNDPDVSESERVHCMLDIIGDGQFFIVASDRSSPVSEGAHLDHARSICMHAVLRVGSGLFNIPDLTADWRFKRNPWCQKRNMRRYAGLPLQARVDSDAVAFSGSSQESSPALETIGTLCVFSATPGDPDQASLQQFALLTKLATREIETLYAIAQRERESAMRQSINDLLALPVLRPDLLVRSPEPSVDLLDERGRPLPFRTPSWKDRRPITIYETAAASLRQHLSGELAVVLELPATADSARGTEAILGVDQVEGGERPSTDALNTLSGRLLEAFESDQRTDFAASEDLLRDYGLALKSVPVYDVDEVPRLLLLVFGKDEHALFGRPELAFVALVGQILLGAHAVARLLLSSASSLSFVQQVSHELRTPLFSLLGTIETMRETAPPSALPTLEPLLHTADTCCVSLRDVLEDVLLFNQPETSDAARPSVETDLRTLVMDTCLVGSSRYVARDSRVDSEEMESIKTASIGLEVEQRPSKDFKVRISAAGLQRVLLNLLSNAIKHTPETGKITMRLSLGRTASQQRDIDSATAIIEVADTGVGMSHEFVEHGLFQPFVQAHSAKDGAHIPSGAGLGAALVKQIVQVRLKGEIEVQSQLNVGTTIRLLLPVQLSSPIPLLGSFPMASESLR